MRRRAAINSSGPCLGSAPTSLRSLIVKRSRDLERYRFIMLFVAFGSVDLSARPGPCRLDGANINGTKLWIGVGGFIDLPARRGREVPPRDLLRELLRRKARAVHDFDAHVSEITFLPDLRAFGPIAVAAVMSLIVILGERDIGFALLLFVVFVCDVVGDDRTMDLRRYRALVAFVVATLDRKRAAHGRQRPHRDLARSLEVLLHGSATTPDTNQYMVSSHSAEADCSAPASVLVKQRRLPVATSDFIFAAFGEELGLFGTTAIIVAFLLMAGCWLSSSNPSAVRVRETRRARLDRAASVFRPFSSSPASYDCCRSPV